MPGKQLAFYFDSSSCSGCKTCQVACRDKHNLGKGILWRRVYEVVGGEWEKRGEAWVPDIFSYYVSMACNHCMDPICLKSCPNAAIVKDQRGLVLVDAGRCMGCRYCEWTCPYGALFYDWEKGIMTKCTMCSDYTSRGKVPACVSACPMRVLDAGPLEKLKEGSGSVLSEDPGGAGGTAMFPLPDPAITRPALVINPHPHSLKAAKGQLKINNREEVRHGQQ